MCYRTNPTIWRETVRENFYGITKSMLQSILIISYTINFIKVYAKSNKKNNLCKN